MIDNASFSYQTKHGWKKLIDSAKGCLLIISLLLVGDIGLIYFMYSILAVGKTNLGIHLAFACVGACLIAMLIVLAQMMYDRLRSKS